MGSEALRDSKKHTQSVLFRASYLGESDVHMDHCRVALSAVLEGLTRHCGLASAWGVAKTAISGRGNSIYKGSEAGGSMRHQG